MTAAVRLRGAGVTEQKRSRHDDHDGHAVLVATGLACHRSLATVQWVAALQVGDRRFPALRVEFERALGTT